MVKDEFWIQHFGSDPGQRMQNRGLELERRVYDAMICDAGIEIP
jgi:hypothetical protein